MKKLVFRLFCLYWSTTKAATKKRISFIARLRNLSLNPPLKKTLGQALSIPTFCLFFFSLGLLFLPNDGWSQEKYTSKYFSIKKDLSAYEKDLIKTLPQEKENIEALFAENPVFTNIRVSVGVGDEVMDKMFTDLEFTAKRSKRFSRIPYIVEEETPRLFSIKQEPKLAGKIEILYLDKAANRFIYRIRGAYKGFMVIRGEMYIDVRYRVVNEQTTLNAHTFILLTNPYVWESTRLFRLFSDLAIKIDRIIDHNIKNVVNLGRKTALDIKHNSP